MQKYAGTVFDLQYRNEHDFWSKVMFLAEKMFQQATACSVFIGPSNHV